MLVDAPERYCVMGVPIDRIDMETVIERIDNAILSRQRLLISTVNTNFLVANQIKSRFRDSLVASDLCTADGVGVLLICRMLAIDIGARVTGADILERVCSRTASRLGRPLRLFLLGGAPGVADAASRIVNAKGSAAVCCVGALNPGFGDMDELCRQYVIDTINAAQPDFLVVSLGAERGQEWLLRNAGRLDVPVCSHLGAALNFLAGTVRRAPPGWRAMGLEWCWRILEEPKLAARYLRDGSALASMLLLKTLPMAALRRWEQHMDRPKRPLSISLDGPGERTRIVLNGPAIAAYVPLLRERFLRARELGRDIDLDLNGLDTIDSAGLGQILRLLADATSLGLKLRITGIVPRIERRLKLEAVAWLC